MKIYQFWSPFGSGVTLYFKEIPEKEILLQVLKSKHVEQINNPDYANNYGMAYAHVYSEEGTDYIKTFFKELEVIDEHWLKSI